MKAFALIPLSLLLACSVPSSVEPLSVPLRYEMMASASEFPRLPDCAVLSEVVVVDVRDDRALGDRAIEGQDEPAVPVTASSDVTEWIRAGVEDALKVSGVSLGRSGAPVLRIKVERIRTVENVYRRSGYDGRITLSAEIAASGGAGVIWWQRHSNGNAENYGYSGSIENYQETLNHALDRALISLFESPGFERAVCESCASHAELNAV